MRKRLSKRQKDTQDLAPHVLDAVAPDTEQPPSPEAEPKPKKNPAAVALGGLGAKKGGKARAAMRSAKKRTAIAQKAAKAR
jgi:hypothetical protein